MSYADFRAFRRYAVKTSDQETLCHKRQISRQELSNRFSWFLCSPPSPQLINQVSPPTCSTRSLPWVYGYDAKWVGRSPMILIHRDVTHRESFWWSVAKNEGRAAVYADLLEMTQSVLTHSPIGIVTDGKPGIAQVLKDVFNLDYHQRCLVHVVRDLKKYLPLRSPIEATQELRSIALTITAITSLKELQTYWSDLDKWQRKYGYLLKEVSHPEPDSRVKRKWWYTHGNLRRAWNLLTNDPTSLFHYLENEMVPKTNNSLEGVNRHLGRRVGMSKAKQLSLMLWKVAFSRIKTKAQEKMLWGMFKERL